MTDTNETSSTEQSASRSRRALVLTSIALIGGLAGGAAVWAQSGGSSATLTRPTATAISTTVQSTASTSASASPTTMASNRVAPVATTTAMAHDATHDAPDMTDTGDTASTTTYCDGWIEHIDLGEHHGPMTIHDTTNGAEPTAEDCVNARAFYDSVTAGIAQYANLDAAKAAGYETRERSTEGGPFRHYFMRGGVTDVLNVAKPEGLMFYTDPATGVATLVGAVFSERTDGLPQPGGPLTTWHDHHDASMCSASDPDCGSGAPRMLHTWTFASAIDPFAMDLPHAVGQQGSRKSFNPNA